MKYYERLRNGRKKTDGNQGDYRILTAEYSKIGALEFDLAPNIPRAVSCPEWMCQVQFTHGFHSVADKREKKKERCLENRNGMENRTVNLCDLFTYKYNMYCPALIYNYRPGMANLFGFQSYFLF